jgi:hypothetical protein
MGTLENHVFPQGLISPRNPFGRVEMVRLVDGREMIAKSTIKIKKSVISNQPYRKTLIQCNSAGNLIQEFFAVITRLWSKYSMFRVEIVQKLRLLRI